MTDKTLAKQLFALICRQVETIGAASVQTSKSQIAFRRRHNFAAVWLPSVRFAHSLEILVDSLVYAGSLVWLLLGQRAEQHDRSTRLSSFSPIAGHRR